MSPTRMALALILAVLAGTAVFAATRGGLGYADALRTQKAVLDRDVFRPMTPAEARRQFLDKGLPASLPAAAVISALLAAGLAPVAHAMHRWPLALRLSWAAPAGAVLGAVAGLLAGMVLRGGGFHAAPSLACGIAVGAALTLIWRSRPS